jgi:arylsulfatase A-like enzyme/predicted Zn-dependent protease
MGVRVPSKTLSGAVAIAACLTLACGPSEDESAARVADGSKSTQSQSGSGEGRDVLLITVDTLRHDATGFSGAGRVATPITDRLAATGRVFSFAHAHAVVTLPSHASILTGLYPYQHGIHDNAGFVLRDDIPTLAAILERQGYATAAFVSAFTVDRRFGLARGFDVYDDRYEGYRGFAFSPPERPGSETVALALEWWEANRGAPRFLWVHVFTPHFPYEPGEPYASRHRDEPYFGEAAKVDEELRPILETVLVGPDADAIVIYTSDHGESLGEHGEATHGVFAYESTLRVPLVVRARNLVTPGVTDEPARHVDIVPTVLDLLGIGTPPGLPGRSLLAGAPEGHDPGSYFEALSTYLNRGWAPLRGRIEGTDKAIQLPLPELYDLGEDPGEERDRSGEDAARMNAVLDRIPEFTDPNVGRGDLDPDLVRRLEKLGYVAADRPGSPEAFDASTDPKNLIADDQVMDEALARYARGDVDGAMAAMRRLIERQPTMSLAYSHLSYFLTDLGRPAEAVAVLEQAIERGAGNESIHRKLALGLIAVGDPARGWQVLEPYADSPDPETQSALGRAAATLGRNAEARARFDRALELDPTYPTARMDLGILLMTEGRLEEARPMLEDAVARDPFLSEAWNGLGVIRMQTGDIRGAVVAWERALQADPRLSDAWYNLGYARSRLGDAAGAAEALRNYVPLVQGSDREQALQMIRQLEASAGSGR